MPAEKVEIRNSDGSCYICVGAQQCATATSHLLGQEGKQLCKGCRKEKERCSVPLSPVSQSVDQRLLDCSGPASCVNA